MLFKDELNPLSQRFGKEFFAALPTTAGVYLMKSASGAILYVGKAKNLRNRLRSYKNARPSVVSRKVIRLLRLVHSIEIRQCADEKDALLTENQLLRELRPPFNVLNTYPETYYFITVGRELGRPIGAAREPKLRFCLTTDPEYNGERVYGVFKGRRTAREGYAALLRVLCALGCNSPRFMFPTVLTRPKPPPIFAVHVAPEITPLVGAFLSGRSKGLLEKSVELLLGNDLLPRFIHHVIEEDLKMLEEFFRRGPRRVRRLKRLSGIRYRPIAQDEIDDLLVKIN